MLPQLGSSPVQSKKISPHTTRLTVAAQAPAITVTAYSVDGTNSGTARLGRNVTLNANISGQSNPSYVWSVQGAGTITSAGIYTAPAAMPADSSVTITATLASNSTVTGTYTLQLIYSAPTILWTTPSTLLSGETNTVTIAGNDFTASTTLTVGGVSVPATFNGTNGVVAQIPVAAGVTAPVSIVATNPTPGGGNSVAVSAAVKAPAMTLNAYSVDGTNSGTARLGRNVTINASVVGMTSPSVTWSVQGAGTITNAGVYTAPATMPSSGTVTVTAALVSNPAVVSSYTLTLIYTAPTIQWVIPATLVSGQTNSVQIGGPDFTAATTVKVGGVVVPTVFSGTNQVLAQISIPSGSTSPVSIVASNPAPGGGSGAAISAPVQAPAMTLTAYSVDGTNSGTARLGRNVTVQAAVPGNANAAVNWSIQGAGSISASGVYTAPTAMPSNGIVAVTAKLASNASVSATYTLTLIYTAPTIQWVIPSTLISGQTNSVQIGGPDFTPATTITVGGVPVPTVFAAPNQVVAQIAIPAGSTSAVSIVASNPTPGGGTGVAVSAPVQAPDMTLTAYSVDGTNTGTARLGRNVTIQATVAGSLNAAVNWSVQGAGTISSAGVYTAPTAMPSSGTVTITAKLASNASVSASYTLSLVYTAPTIQWVIPSSLTSGATNSIQIGGDSFTAATTITVNGSPVTATFNGSNGMQAQIPIAAGSLTAVSVVASNPTPGGGDSVAVSAPIKPLSITLSSYSTTAVNPTSASLGQSIQFAAVVSGGNSAISWPVTWSVQGGGSISSTGLYQSPAAMPSSTSVIVTATLVSNTSVTSSTSLTLVSSAPVVNRSQPVLATAGATNTITFFGTNFTSGTTIQVNGQPVATTYLTTASVSAAIDVAQGASGVLSITAVNPDPNGGQSGVFSLSIGDATTVQATIGTTAGRTIPGDFVGFSHEWGEQTYMGTAQTGVNNIYRQLVKNLSNPGTPFFIRIGGGSTDNTVEPAPTTVGAFSELATAMPVRFTLGVNLAANNLQLSEDQVSNYVANMPAGSLAGIELGNEADNYYQSGVRPSTYNFTDYLADFAKWHTGIAPLLPQGVKMIGPSLTTVWHLQQNLSALEQAEANNISIISAHYYGGYEGTVNGVVKTFAPNYLLQDSTVTHSIPGLGIIATGAHSNGQTFRIDETNTIDEGGLLGVSNTFSAALWAADVMFAEANAGVDGVNWHGTNACTYCAFTFGMQNATGINTFRLQKVNPLYYGLLFFHDATANSAQLLPVTVSSASGANVKVWATVDAAGTVHVAILNKDETFSGSVSVTLPGYGLATAIRMVAPNYKSEAGITIGGQTFDNSFDGTPIGSAMSESFAATNSVYTIPVQPTSAVLLTLTK